MLNSVSHPFALAVLGNLPANVSARAPHGLAAAVAAGAVIITPSNSSPNGTSNGTSGAGAGAASAGATAAAA